MFLSLSPSCGGTRRGPALILRAIIWGSACKRWRVGSGLQHDLWLPLPGTEEGRAGTLKGQPLDDKPCPPTSAWCPRIWSCLLGLHAPYMGAPTLGMTIRYSVALTVHILRFLPRTAAPGRAQLLILPPQKAAPGRPHLYSWRQSM